VWKIRLIYPHTWQASTAWLFLLTVYFQLQSKMALKQAADQGAGTLATYGCLGQDGKKNIGLNSRCDDSACPSIFAKLLAPP